MSADQLVVCFREDEVANLRTGVDAVQRLEVDGVPKTDALISCSSACCKETSSEWTPIDCFHCSLVIRELFKRRTASSRPNEQLVVVSTCRQLVLTMETPPHSTYFLLVLVELHVVLV